MFGTSNEATKPYVFSNDSFMVTCAIIDDEQCFETVMNKEEDRGEQSSNFFPSIKEEKYLNGMLIRNDEPKVETIFGLHTICVHVGATETEDEQLAKIVVNKDATKSEEDVVSSMEIELYHHI